MLSVRPAQWQALTEAGLGRFAQEMFEHLCGFAPELADFAGTDRVHEVVRLGIARGRAHRFTHRGPLRTYLEMMLALGSDFDTDPALRRASAALRARELEQHRRARLLYEDVLQYCERVNGLQNGHALAALRRLRDVPYEALASSGNFHERTLLLFRGCFPEKYQYAGEAALRQFATGAARKAEEYGVGSDAGRQLMALLLFLFGHGAFADPAYRWMAETMRDAALPGPEQRVRELHRKARLYLAAALKNHPA